MTSRDFCFWLQGFFELSDPHGGLTQEQADTIEKHLKLVFKHEIDPSAGSAGHQAELNEIHNPETKPVTPENLEQAVKDAIAKLPKQVAPSSFGPDTVLRC